MFGRGLPTDSTAGGRVRAMSDELPAVHRLFATVQRLRAADGCPWDRAQTTASMAPHLLEEAYEALDALRTGDDGAARDELGDVLVNVTLIAQIARERGAFDLDAVAAAAADKLVRRHPHVFGSARADGHEQAYRNWEHQKQQEHAAAGAPRGLLDGVPAALPALLAAYRVGEKAARVGFDWPDLQGPRRKVDEELAELDAAIAGGDAAKIADELGDVLFSLVNLARHVRVEPETALRATIDRFRNRFRRVEQELGPDLRGRTLDELDAAWNRAKAALAGDGPRGAVGGPSTE
jgi:tetrapyrrole methylase family protein/MazG family protein/ATP diphosphatase